MMVSCEVRTLSTTWKLLIVLGSIITPAQQVDAFLSTPIIKTLDLSTNERIGISSTQTPPSLYSRTILSQTNNNNSDSNDNNNEVDKDQKLLNQRLSKLQAQLYETELSRPPNPSYSAHEFISELCKALKDPDDPLPNSGYRVLWRCSSKNWRGEITKRIGIPVSSSTLSTSFVSSTSHASNVSSPSSSTKLNNKNNKNNNKFLPEDIITSALGTSLSRPQNQFAILVSADDVYQSYTLHLGDTLDYNDGTCWVDAQLRSVATPPTTSTPPSSTSTLPNSNSHDNNGTNRTNKHGINSNSSNNNHPKRRMNEHGKLLVKLGWSLVRREEDGAWIMDGLDWQDFREEFRPGIGREEWVRICG